MKNNNPPSGFLMTIDQALEFWKRCEQTNANTFEERLLILKQMAEERRVFPQSGEQIEKRLQGKRVLRLKHKKDDIN